MCEFEIGPYNIHCPYCFAPAGFDCEQFTYWKVVRINYAHGERIAKAKKLHDKMNGVKNDLEHDGD